MKRITSIILTLMTITLLGCENKNTSRDSSPRQPFAPIEVPANTREVINFNFGGMVNDEFNKFYQIGWMAGNCKFYDDDLRLIDDEGFFRTPVLDITQEEIYVEMTSHITGLNSVNDNAIGKNMILTVYGLDEAGETIDSAVYTHTLSGEDKSYQSFADFPSYTSDFSSLPYIVKLNGAHIKKVKVELTQKISYLSDSGKNAGCNFAIKNITIKESL